jgi:hypothetical protein
MNKKKLEELTKDIEKLLFTKYGFTVGNSMNFANMIANWVRRYLGISEVPVRKLGE